MTIRVASASVNTINLDSLDPPATNKPVLPTAAHLDSLDPPPQVDTGKSIQQRAKKHCESCEDALVLSSAKEQAKLAESLKTLQVQKKETTPIQSTPRQQSNPVKNAEASVQALAENKSIQGNTIIKNTASISPQSPGAHTEVPKIQIDATFTKSQNKTILDTHSKSPFISTQNHQKITLPSNQNQVTHLGDLPKTVGDKTHQPQKMTDRAAPTKEAFGPAQSDIKTNGNQPVYQFTSFGQIQQMRAQSQGTLFISTNNTLGAQANFRKPTAQMGQQVPGTRNANPVILRTQPQTTHLVRTPANTASTISLTASIPLIGVVIPQVQINLTGAIGLNSRNSVMPSKGTLVLKNGDSESLPVDKNQKPVLSQNPKVETSILQKITKTFLGPLQNITGVFQTLMSQIFGAPSKLATSMLAKIGELLSSLIMKLKKSRKVKKKKEATESSPFADENTQPGLATL